MAIYKPSLLDKFKDFVNGLKSNWDQYEAHVADFESHQAESASKHIHSSGSNAYGDWIRFDNGWQICTGVQVITNAITQSWGALYFVNIGVVHFPVDFLAGTVPSFSAFTETKDSIIVAGNTITNTSVSLLGYRGTAITESKEHRVRWMAIGRWK